MRHMVLIACGKRKGSVRDRARDLYQGELFRKSLAYAQSLSPDAIYILSAKHGLLALDAEVDPYDVTLKVMNKEQRAAWASSVLRQLRQVAHPTEDRFTFLAAEAYRKQLLPHLTHHQIPMRGLGIGRQLRFLKEALA